MQVHGTWAVPHKLLLTCLLSSICLLHFFFSELEDIADLLDALFVTLEPEVFDFRTPMMKVEFFCSSQSVSII